MHRQFCYHYSYFQGWSTQTSYILLHFGRWPPSALSGAPNSDLCYSLLLIRGGIFRFDNTHFITYDVRYFGLAPSQLDTHITSAFREEYMGVIWTAQGTGDEEISFGDFDGEPLLLQRSLGFILMLLYIIIDIE